MQRTRRTCSAEAEGEDLVGIVEVYCQGCDQLVSASPEASIEVA